MKPETIRIGDNKYEYVRTRTIGADFDIEHDMLFREYCRINGIDGATLLRAVMYQFLDEYAEKHDAAIRDMLGGGNA